LPATLSLAITILSYFVLYGPQPLLPRLGDTFGVSESQTALLMTLTLLPLGVAPIAYGAVLSRVSSRNVLLAGVAGLGVASILFGAVGQFGALLALRLVQGLLLPAVLTAMMTALSERTEKSRMQRVMSAYIASTIVGGLGGRLISGTFATYAQWPEFFFLVGAGLLATLPFLWRTPSGSAARDERITLRGLREVWVRDRNWQMYAAIFCLFFVFVGVLNFLPFRVRQLHPGASEFTIGLIYTGYVMGIATALGTRRIIAVLGSARRARVAGYTIYAASLAPMLLPSLAALFASIFGFCLGMFLVHSIASATVNQSGGRQRGMVNGLYVSSYYAGGVLGSYLPGLILERVGWTPMVATLAAVAALGVVLIALPRPDHGDAAAV